MRHVDSHKFGVIGPARETHSQLYIIANAKTAIIIIIYMTVTHAMQVDRGRAETGAEWQEPRSMYSPSQWRSLTSFHIQVRATVSKPRVPSHLVNDRNCRGQLLRFYWRWHCGACGSHGRGAGAAPGCGWRKCRPHTMPIMLYGNPNDMACHVARYRRQGPRKAIVKYNAAVSFVQLSNRG